MFVAVMYPSLFCRVRVTSPSSESNLKFFCVVRISADVSWFRVYSDKKSEKLFFFMSRNWSQRRCWNIEIFCKFCYFGTIFAISETKVSYLFPHWSTASIVRHFAQCSNKTIDQTHYNHWIFVSLILWYKMITSSTRHYNVKKRNKYAHASIFSTNTTCHLYRPWLWNCCKIMLAKTKFSVARKTNQNVLLSRTNLTNGIPNKVMRLTQALSCINYDVAYIHV